MVGLILISILMLGLGVGMAVIFFKQLPLYKQIKLIAKMPSIKYKDYSRQARKSVVTYSIIAYVVCIAFAVFAIVVALRSGIASNYLWIIVVSYGVVLALSVASMVLMIVKVVQLSKIKRTLIEREVFSEEEHTPEAEEVEPSKEQQPPQDSEAKKQQQTQQESKEYQPEKSNVMSDITLSQVEDSSATKSEEQTQPADAEKTVIINNVQPKVETKQDKLFSDGIFELADQLQKLREMHISGLISEGEYTLLREKWLNAVLSAPLFGKKPHRTKKPMSGKTAPSSAEVQSTERHEQGGYPERIPVRDSHDYGKAAPSS